MTLDKRLSLETFPSQDNNNSILTMEIPDITIGAAVCDPELCRLVEQRLRLWLREETCYQRYIRQLQYCDLRMEGPCNGPDCNFMVELLKHKRTCKDGDNCTSSDCKVMNRIIKHWTKCNNYDCLICGPSLANLTKPLATFKSAPSKEWHQRESLSEAQRQHAVRLLVQFLKIRPNHRSQVAQMVYKEAEKYFEADSLAEYYHLLAEKMWDMEIEKKHHDMEMKRFYSLTNFNDRDILQWRCS